MNPEALAHQHRHDRQDEQESSLQDWLLSRTGIATVVVVSVLAFLIYEGHAAHMLGALPYLLILSCPLMHIAGTIAMTRASRVTTGKVSDGPRDGQ